MIGPVLPLHRTIVAVDIEGSTRRAIREQAHIRTAMYDLLEEALVRSGISEQNRDLIDIGDGCFVLVHPTDQVPKTLLLTTLVPTLSRLLHRWNLERPDQRFRLRAAIHAGEVHADARGWFGESLDITARLLHSPELKVRLSQTTEPLALVVSQDIYLTVIRHSYHGIDDSSFEPAVQVQIAGQRYHGWVQIPGSDHRSEHLPA